MKIKVSGGIDIKTIDKTVSCCFTGHRYIDDAKYVSLRERVAEEIEKLYNDGYRNFLCGGAIGFDTLVAFEVISARIRHNDIRLYLILPCADQSSLWREFSKTVYERMKRAADMVITLHDEFTKGCMHERNRIMLENSTACVAYFDGRNKGGTFYTCKMAMSKGHKFINLYDQI